MNELLLKYLDYIVEHQLHNDAGVRKVRDLLQGNVDYLAFRQRWAWDDEKAGKLLASESGRQLREHIAAVAANFEQQDGIADYTLGTGDLRRSLNTQTNHYKANWSVLKFAPDLLGQLTTELEQGTYPDPPDVASAKKLAKFIVRAKLANVRKTEKNAWKSSPANAAPGLSDHGRLSAVDFVVKKHGNDMLGADSAQVPLWRKKKNCEPSFAERLNTAIGLLNQTSGSSLFEGLGTPPTCP